ncbi:MAG TPA: META domain-containing protein [Patescibacteria group bacterium]|nr:META domain-containing protein [Patescibacteria group bacterium]
MKQLLAGGARLSAMRSSIGLLAIVLAACGSSATSVEPSASTDGDPTGAWQLAAAIVDGQELELLDDHPVTAVIEGSTIGGRSACNEYGGRIEVAGDGVRIGELGGTAMACGPDEVMALEAAYLAALGRVRAIEVIDGRLALRGQAVDLRFDPLPEPPVAELVDTTWVLETVFVGDVASPPDGEPATLELRSDGTFSGSTGCRTFTGRWIESRAQIQAPELRMGETECPAELAGQDSHVVSVIGDGFVPSVEGDLLTLLDPGGVGLVYRAEE